MDDDAPSPTAGRISRRGALSMGVTASAVGLAAAGCATYSPGSGGEAEPGSGEAGSGGAGADLGPSSGVPVGGGKIFKEQKVVVTQPTAGTFRAFSATCTHTGCSVAEVSGDTIRCPCHGSTFSTADGSVTNGPARRPLAAMRVSSDGGTLRVT